MLLLPALFLLTGLGLLAPGDAAPKCRLVDGAGEYVFQSARESILVPLGATMAGLFLLASAFVCGTRRPREGPVEREGAGVAEAPNGDGSVASTRMQKRRPAVSRVILLVGLGALALCVAGMGMVDPVCRFRRATVYADRVELHSLFFTWVLRRGQVDRVEMLQEVSGRGERTRYELCLEVTAAGGERYRSVGRRLGETDKALTAWRGVMRRFVTEMEAPPPSSGKAIEEYH